jgi:hypothetical protein
MEVQFLRRFMTMPLKERYARLKNACDEWFAEKPGRFLIAFVFVVGGIGVSLIVYSTYLSAESLAGRFWGELGIAFTIAAILALGVESFAQLKAAEELKRNVLAAVFKRLIPEPVFNQVRDHVLTAVQVRRKYCLSMKLTRELNGRPGEFECETCLSYELHNITGYSPKSLIIHDLDHDLEGRGSDGNCLPRYTIAVIDGQPLDLNKCIVNKYRLEHETMLPKGKSLLVKINSASIRKVPDTWNWNMSALAEGATIEIEFAVPDVTGVKFEVRALHPQHKDLHPMDDNGTHGKWKWSFEPALLTWQGFEITSSRDEVGQK